MRASTANAERRFDAVALVVHEPAHDERGRRARPARARWSADARMSIAPVRFASTRSTGRRRRREDVAGAEVDRRAAAGSARRCARPPRRRRRRCRRRRTSRAPRRPRGHRQHARAGAEVEHRAARRRSASLERAQAQPRRRWWPVPKPIDGSMTMSVLAGGHRLGHVPRRRDDEAAGGDGRERLLAAGHPVVVGQIDALERSGRGRGRRGRRRPRRASASSAKQTRQASGVGGGSGGGGAVGSHRPPGGSGGGIRSCDGQRRVVVEGRGDQAVERAVVVDRRRRGPPAPASGAAQPKMSLTLPKRPLSSSWRRRRRPAPSVACELLEQLALLAR